MITQEDLDAQVKEGSWWVVLHHNVYDIKSLSDRTPCGADKLMEYVGKDATKAYGTADHTDSAKETLEQCLIGQFGNVCESIVRYFDILRKTVFVFLPCGPLGK